MGTYLRMTPATRAVLEFLLATDRPTWGLIIVRATGRPSGTVYPLLERLEREFFVTSYWDDSDVRTGPRRRLYSLTSSGAAWAKEKIAATSSERNGHE